MSYYTQARWQRGIFPKQIKNLRHNSILTGLLGDLAIIAVHGHSTLISKIDVCSPYICIHPRNVIAILLFIGG